MNEIEIDRDAEWAKTLKLMQGLYPRWNVTMEQLDAWKLELGMLNPEWLRESLRVVYGRYNSDNPKVKWVKEAFKEVRAGHRGIPLDESDAMGQERKREHQESEAHEAQVKLDRENAWKEVSAWTNEERVKWGNIFASKYKMFSEKKELDNFGTWSKTFCQFVKVYRSMSGGVTNVV